MSASDIDPVTLRVLGGAFNAIAREMAQALYRMSNSSIIRESEDIGCGIFDVTGQELCESETSPMHIGSLPFYIRGFMRKLEGRIEEGDVIIHNHPYHGASHTPDLGVATPIFHDGELIGFAAATAHLVAEEADRREAFNEQRRRRVHRGLDWLILNVDEKDLPETFREEAKAQRSKRGGKKNNANKRRDGTTSRNPSGEDAADGVDPAMAALATTLRRAGFPADVALASAAASDGDQWGALMDLCASQ